MDTLFSETQYLLNLRLFLRILLNNSKVASFEFQEVKWDQNQVPVSKVATFEFQGVKWDKNQVSWIKVATFEFLGAK